MLRRLVALLIGLVVGLSPAVTTTASAATITYDTPAIARVDAHQLVAAEAGHEHLGTAWQGSALAAIDARGTSTTPVRAGVATNTGPDFVAGPVGSAPPVPVSQSRMTAGFDEAGFPSTQLGNRGVQYELPGGGNVRAMEPTPYAPRRASFENANGGPINPFTGKPVQPPPGLTPAERLKYIRDRTHVDQAP